MKTSRTLFNALVAVAVFSFTGSIFVGVSAAQPVSAQAADNSAQNKGEANTADKQTNAASDRLTAAQVRKALIADKDLSTYAHNVKVLVADGTVTLKGPVKSDDEKQKVVADAASVVAADKIANQLTVK